MLGSNETETTEGNHNIKIAVPAPCDVAIAYVNEICLFAPSFSTILRASFYSFWATKGREISYYNLYVQLV